MGVMDRYSSKALNLVLGILLICFIFAAAHWVASDTKYWSRWLFEFVIFLWILLLGKVTPVRMDVVTWIIAIYIGMTAFFWVLDANVLDIGYSFDLLIEIKPLLVAGLYILLRPPSYGHAISALSVKIIKTFLLVFFAKYLYLSTEGIGRPELIAENNFEVIFCCLMWLVISEDDCKKSEKLFFYIIVLLIAIMSGSRSGLSAIGALSILTIPGLIGVANSIAVFLAAAIVFTAVFLSVPGLDDSRLLSGYMESDRVKFLTVFVSEMSSKPLVDVIFGHISPVALDPVNCNSLEFYQGKFSKFDPNACYAVILHSGLMRNLWNFGIFGAVFIQYSVIVLFRRYGATHKQAFSAFAICFLSGLAVSGQSHSMVIVGLMITAHVLGDKRGNVD